MSVIYDRKAQQFEIECDSCGATEMFHDVESWKEGMNEAKKSGWAAHNRGGEWTHTCKTCNVSPLSF